MAKTPDEKVIFNSGELADSLAMEHLTKAGQEFIPWFGETENGYLFMLTKSDNVDEILGLPHNGHTIIAFSMNAPEISRKFEVGAPSFERRLEAARKVQEAGYPLRIRIDPIVPVDGWQTMYSETIKRIFDVVSPERITLGTLRFEDQFYKMRDNFITTGPDLINMMNEMIPMFHPKLFPGKKKPKSGKYSFSDDKRVEIFDFAIKEIRKYSDCRIALCKESADVWHRVGLELSRCSCVCQLDYADMAGSDCISGQLNCNHKPEWRKVMQDTPIEDLELKLIRKFLLAHPSIYKTERDRALNSEKYSDDLKSLISVYPVTKSNPY